MTSGICGDDEDNLHILKLIKSFDWKEWFTQKWNTFLFFSQQNRVAAFW